jgi:DNA polymerase-3 subunit alpha
LNELGLKRTKGLQLKMDTASISSEMITQIEELCNEFSGDCPLFLRLQDDKENINLELLSRKYRVRPINDMVKKIKKIQDLQVEVVF